MRMRAFIKDYFFSCSYGHEPLDGAGGRGAVLESAPASLSATTVPKHELMQPAELAGMLKASGAERPVVFQVGSFVMFQQAHIPNSGFAGPGSQPSGIDASEEVCGAAQKEPIDRDLLWLLPVESRARTSVRRTSNCAILDSRT